ncbi:MAG: Pseudouridine synthase [Candidatus Uhrbacteria bacterium GW2011_GWF2_40_263]|nr:MAG: Pseudouridine synthase [Candidatus Uhrbacteria bacterium GW2011_GWF2_40_263]
MNTIRINKYLAEHGYASRREADKLIKAGLVFLNGKRANLGDQVTEKDEVVLKNQKQKTKANLVYLVFHKPVGMITTTDLSKRDNVTSFINYPERIFPIGRLDVISSGLLLLTNDGELANRLMHPKYEHEKEYLVEVEESLKGIDLKKMEQGIKIDEKKTAPSKAIKLTDHQFRLTLTEGRNRQIRRMCEALGYTVTSLKRIRILNIHLKNLQEGKWRKLTSQELRTLKYQLGISKEK